MSYPIGEIITENYNNNIIFAEIISDESETPQVLSIITVPKNIYVKIIDFLKIFFIVFYLIFFLGVILYLIISSINYNN